MSSDLHEILAIIVMVMIFAGTGLAGIYIWTLTRFFNELQEKEPQVWQDIGNPTLANMTFLPFIKFYKFYSFVPALKERWNSNYKYASRAYFLLCFGLVYCMILFVGVIILAILSF